MDVPLPWEHVLWSHRSRWWPGLHYTLTDFRIVKQGGDAIRELAGRHPAVLLAHHGPVVAAADLLSAVDAIEELEATARLALLTHGMNPHRLSAEQIEAVRFRT